MLATVIATPIPILTTALITHVLPTPTTHQAVLLLTALLLIALSYSTRLPLELAKLTARLVRRLGVSSAPHPSTPPLCGGCTRRGRALLARRGEAAARRLRAAATDAAASAAAAAHAIESRLERHLPPTLAGRVQGLVGFITGGAQNWEEHKNRFYQRLRDEAGQGTGERAPVASSERGTTIEGVGREGEGGRWGRGGGSRSASPSGVGGGGHWEPRLTRETVRALRLLRLPAHMVPRLSEATVELVHRFGFQRDRLPNPTPPYPPPFAPRPPTFHPNH